MENQLYRMPMVALRGMTILPEMVVHFDVSRAKSVEAVHKAMQNEGQKIFLVAQRELQTEDPELKDVYAVGTIATVKQIAKMPKNLFRVLAVGEARARLVRMESNGGLVAEVEVLTDMEPEEELSNNPQALNLKQLFFEYTVKRGKVPKEVITQIADIKSFKSLVYQVAANVAMDYNNLQEILEQDDVVARCEVLSYKLANEMAVIELKDEISRKVKENMDKHQKEFILREQMKVIREELGEDNLLSDAEEFEQQTKKLRASSEVKERLLKEIKRFRSSQQSAAENGVIRTYIETMLEMPWDKVVSDHTDLAYAKQILEEEHYGLEQVKERILEFLAVRALTKKGESPILCLVGPPGTGKTSIAKSLAKALKKPYARISLGGDKL